MGKNNDSMDFFMKVAAMRHLQKQQYKVRIRLYKKEISKESADKQLADITERLNLVTKMVDDKLEYGLDFITEEMAEDSDMDDVVKWGVKDAIKLHKWKVEKGYVNTKE